MSTRIVSNFTTADSLQKYITKEYLIDYSLLGFDVQSEDLYWYTNIGVVGWLYVLPWYQIPIYLFYVLLLAIIPYWITGKYIRSRYVMPVLHVAVVMYLFHGWFEVYFGLVFSLVWYSLLIVLFKRKRTTSSKRQPLPFGAPCENRIPA